MERPSGGWSPRDSALEAESLVSRSCTVEDGSLGAFLDVVPGSTDVDVGWATPDGLEIAGIGEAATLSADGPDRFKQIERQATAVFDRLEYDGPTVARPRAFGGFPFHDGAIEPSDHPADSPWRGFESATFVIPRVQVTRTDEGPWLTVTGETERSVIAELSTWRETIADLPTLRPAGSPPGVIETERSVDRQQWTDSVELALERIEDGSLEKLVLAQALTATLGEAVAVTELLERLRRRYPNCFRFSIDLGTERTFFGAPPERLANKSGETLTTEALAGSVPRGTSPESDEEHLEHLNASERLGREHDIVVSAIRDQLSALASDVEVADRTVRQLATIQHLLTPMTADVDTEEHVLAFVEALHPTPAVGGVPQRTACEGIRSLENFDRGWYAGPVGWFDADGDGEFVVAIRSGVAAGRSVTLFGGNGIVADSDPAAEWDEVTLKLRAILDELR